MTSRSACKRKSRRTWRSANDQQSHYEHAEHAVKSMLKHAWGLSDLAKMSVDEYQDYFNQFMYADGEE